MRPNRSLHPSRGFTLIEVLVALALVATISLVVMGSLAPWIGMKQKMDTERRLQDIRQGVVALYEDNAFAIEAGPAGTLMAFTSNALDSSNTACVNAEEGFTAAADKFSETAQTIARDGYSNPWCIRVSDPLTYVQDGVTLYYRNIAFISTGSSGALDSATIFDKTTGQLKLGGDNLGVVISGKEIQSAKLRETLRRMTRVAQSYETYFTTRYLANASRDINIDYFSTDFDSGGSVVSTGGAWQPVASVLASVGVSGSDAFSAWEGTNQIEVGNKSEQVAGVTVRSPATTGVGVLPFTALLRAKIPAPSGQDNYVHQVAVGNY